MPDKHGPYRNIRFLLEIDGVARAGFAECRQPESGTDVIEYREGTDPPTVRQLAGLNRYGRVVLRTGVTDDSIELFEWRKLVEQGKVDDARRPAAVVLLDREGETGARWELRNVWPATYRAPRLDATGEDVAIESLDLVCEGFERVA
jgi:phage tail-like protein